MAANRRPTRREMMQSLNLAHRDLGLLYDKPPMLTVAVKPKRERGVTAKDAPPKEHAEQVVVVKWFYHYSKTIGVDYRQLVAVPNGQILFRFANNPNAVLSYLHAEGMRDGMLDLVLFVPKWDFHGMLCEMKRRVGGKVSDDQNEMAAVLRKAGYHCIVAPGADIAIARIKAYCEGK